MKMILSLPFCCILFIGWAQLIRAQLDASSGPYALTFRFYYGKRSDEFDTYDTNNITSVLKHPQFQATDRTTTVYTHGYQENANVFSVQLIVTAYLKLGKHNFLLCNWGPYADGMNYVRAADNVPIVGEYVADVLLKLFEGGLPVELVHLVGHSLGAQICGCVGDVVQKQSNYRYKLPRISGLDPAGPFFYQIALNIVPTIRILIRAMSKNDGKYVDVIHTDVGRAGTTDSCGHADFWPNSGSGMPGCPIVDPFTDLIGVACCHHRSWYYWSDSVVASGNSTCFLSARARDWSSFMAGNVDRSSPLQQMGLDSRSDAFGSYYLQTNANGPFSRDDSGATYDSNVNSPLSW